MRSYWKVIENWAAYFFILLFCYAAVSKMLDFENFQVQLAQSPLLSSYAGFISYGVIILEIIIALVLVFPKGRAYGFYASYGLMLVFTVYIYLILNYSEFVPCSCGGILENMGWNEHLIFNTVCVFVAGAVLFFRKRNWRIGWRRSLIIIGTITVLCTAGMVALFLSSEYMIRKENNFTRRFLQNPLSEKKSFLLNDGRYYFAGFYQNRIYLGDANKPLILTSLNLHLKDLQEMKIIPEKAADLAFRNLRIQVKEGYFYLSDGTVPIIYRGLLSKPRATIISRDEVFFTQMQVLDSLHFIMRSQSSSSHEYVLALLNLNRRPRVSVQEGLLEKQNDGVFDVDGLLKADSTGVVYMYYYRNQYLVLNGQLKVNRKLNTINSKKTTPVSTIEMSNGSRRMDAPSIKININTALYKNLVFNESSVRGKFEPYQDWKQNTVIDIYRREAQYYVGSFRIKKKKNERIEDLLVSDHFLYVLQGNEIQQYSYNRSMRLITGKGEAENLDKE